MRQFPSVENATLRAFAREELGIKASVRQLGGYLGRNAVYLIEPSNVVLKIFFASKDSKTYFDRARNKRAAEAYSYQVLGAHGYPVPVFLGTGEIEGHPCILYEFMPGTLWQDHPVSASAEPALYLYEKLGRLLAHMHEAPLPESTVTPSHMFASEREKIVNRALKLPAPYVRRMQLGAERLREISSMLGSSAQVTPKVLTHGDFTSRNILLTDIPSDPDIRAVIDFERARIADPALDFAMIAFKEFTKGPAIKAAILRGYLSCRALPENPDLRLEMHLLELFLEIAGWARQDDVAYFDTMLMALDRLLEGDEVFRLSDDPIKRND